MRKCVIAFVVAFLILLGNGCERDCDNLRPGMHIPFSAEFEAWMTDSAKLDFDMVDADSTVIHWRYDPPRYGGGKISWYECTEKPMRRHEIHESRFIYTTTSTDEVMKIALHSRDGVQSLLVELNDLVFSYLADVSAFATTQTDEGNIEPVGEMLPTYALRGKVWEEVLQIDTRSSFVTYPRIWIAKGWGVIRYENQAGKAWERLP
jgi:hypothetical protein